MAGDEQEMGDHLGISISGFPGMYKIRGGLGWVSDVPRFDFGWKKVCFRLDLGWVWVGFAFGLSSCGPMTSIRGCEEPA